ncbi:MAG: TadE/TadG family type IV pilus assembly protein [Candidatus Margulisiibacteriota bacterium]|jgi:Flp pilus assembly protein TadG
MFRRRQKGQAIVEFALIAPLLFLMFFATINFGLFFHDYLFVIQSVRDGARYAGIQGSGVGSTAVKNRVISAADNYNLYTMTMDANDLTVAWTADSAQVRWTKNVPINLVFIQTLTVPLNFQVEMPRED